MPLLAPVTITVLPDISGMSAAEKAAMADMKKIDLTYSFAVAGAAFGGGIWALLDSLFAELEQAAQRLPDAFSISLSAKYRPV